MSSFNPWSTLKNAYSFSGRVARAEFWTRAISLFASLVLISLLGSDLKEVLSFLKINLTEILFNILENVLIAATLAIIISILSFKVRRMHDLGLSGWIAVILTILPFITIYFPIVSVVIVVIDILLLLWPGNKGSNKYG